MNPQTWWFRGCEVVQEALADPSRGSTSAALAAVDAVLATSPERSLRACAAGCAACCHLPVAVTQAEAQELADWLAAHAPPAVLDRLASAAAAVEAVDWGAQAAARRPCVLLQEGGTCMAYEHRPIPCRGWHSHDRAACDADHRGEAAAVTPDRPAFAAAQGAHEALRRRLDPEAPTYELTSAVARLVDGRGLGGAKRRP